jgi:hypothetical protein
MKQQFPLALRPDLASMLQLNKKVTFGAADLVPCRSVLTATNQEVPTSKSRTNSAEPISKIKRKKKHEEVPWKEACCIEMLPSNCPALKRDLVCPRHVRFCEISSADSLINSLSSATVFFSIPQTDGMFGGYILLFFWLIRCSEFFAV